MAATILTATYFIQLRFVQPAVMRGELDGLASLTQYNPHGVFIALEEAGYLLMATAFPFAGAALEGTGRLLRAVRWLLFTGGFVAIVLFVGVSAAYGFAVEYRFEVAAITVDWSVLILTSVSLAVVYRSDARVQA